MSTPLSKIERGSLRIVLLSLVVCSIALIVTDMRTGGGTRNGGDTTAGTGNDSSSNDVSGAAISRRYVRERDIAIGPEQDYDARPPLQDAVVVPGADNGNRTTTNTSALPPDDVSEDCATSSSLLVQDFFLARIDNMRESLARDELDELVVAMYADLQLIERCRQEEEEKELMTSPRDDEESQSDNDDSSSSNLVVVVDTTPPPPERAQDVDSPPKDGNIAADD